MELFVVDSMLGKLAVRLRLLGYDTTYYPDAEDSFLLRRSREEGRLLLTHDLALTRVRGANAYFVVNRKLKDQLQEISARFKLDIDHTRLFSRCTVCNDLLRPIARERVKGKVPPQVYKSYDEFSFSPTCGRYYWKGSHYTRLRSEIESLLK
jgi:uncharacterized protein with PIN domain